MVKDKMTRISELKNVSKKMLSDRGVKPFQNW